jgi:hypothetical protein
LYGGNNKNVIGKKCDRELNFSWVKKLYIECCSRKERSGIAWLIAGIWQLKEVRRNADKEDVHYV